MSLEDFDKKYSDGLKFSYKLGQYKSRRYLLSTGILPLDLATGVGGVFTGGSIELMGQFGTGKSSISYNLMADGIRQGMNAMLIDSEGSLNEDIFLDVLEDHGVVVDSLKDIPFRHIPPSALGDLPVKDGVSVQGSKNPALTLERAVPMIHDFIDKSVSPNGAIIVVDSLDFILTDDIIGSTVDTPTVAVVARRMKHFLKGITGDLFKYGHLIVFVHQVSSKIDAHAIDTETFTGGNALKFHSSCSIRFKKIGQEKVGNEVVGENVRFFILKNKRGLSYKTGEYVIRSGIGPDDIGAVFEIAAKLGIIKKRGAWVTTPDGQNHNGKEALRKYWDANRTELEYIRGLILDKARGIDISESMTDQEKSELDE